MIVFLLIVPLLVSLIFAPAPEVRVVTDPECSGSYGLVQQLIQAGYGEVADPQEEIVDRWFRDIVFNMLQDEGLDTSRGSGYINVVPIGKGKSEIS